MPYIHMTDGTVYHLDAYSNDLNTFNVETLAHHLSLINRFTGATSRPYSVAEHSLLCADIAELSGLPVFVQLACLMHDAHEAITGDASTPVKWELGPSWADFEGRHEQALRAHFGLRTVFANYGAEIKRADLIALATERRDLLNFNPAQHAPWPILDTPGRVIQPSSINLKNYLREAVTWSAWKTFFCRRFYDLHTKVESIYAAQRAQAGEPLSERPTAPAPLL